MSIMDRLNTGAQKGMDAALEIAAYDSTQSAQSQHMFQLTLIASATDKGLNDAIKNLDEAQDKMADQACKKTPEQKQVILDARMRQLARKEALADRIAAI